MKKTLVAVFTIFVMIVAACGGSDSGSDNESSQSSADREYNVHPENHRRLFSSEVKTQRE